MSYIGKIFKPTKPDERQKDLRLRDILRVRRQVFKAIRRGKCAARHVPKKDPESLFFCDMRNGAKRVFEKDLVCDHLIMLFDASPGSFEILDRVKCQVEHVTLILENTITYKIYVNVDPELDDWSHVYLGKQLDVIHIGDVYSSSPVEISLGCFEFVTEIHTNVEIQIPWDDCDDPTKQAPVCKSDVFHYSRDLKVYEGLDSGAAAEFDEVE